MRRGESHEQRVLEIIERLDPLSPEDRVARLAGLRASEAPAVLADVSLHFKLPPEPTLGRDPWTDGPPTQVVQRLQQSLGVRLRLDVPPTADPARQLGPYPVCGVLGSGGMGQVLLIEDAEIGRTLAAKVLQTELDADPLAMCKFLLEAQVTGQLEHPNIIPLHELGCTDDGQLYFTMKQVEGEDLDAVLRRPPAEQPTTSQLLDIVGKICDAVEFAHSRGVLHRDLKPANVMVGRFGEVVVCDWGLAKLVSAPGSDGVSSQLEDSQALRAAAGGPLAARATQDGTVMGTVVYMPPEQADGRIHELDARSDVYAIGAILYELLTGCPPYPGTSARDVLRRIEAGPPPDPRERAPSRRIPWELETIVKRAMARRREDRYPSAGALKRDLDAFREDGLLSAARYGPVQRVGKWIRRHRVASALLLVGLLAVTAGGLRSGWRLKVHARKLNRARAAASKLASDDRTARAASLATGLRAEVPLGSLPTPEQLGRIDGALVELRELAGGWRGVLALEAQDPAGRRGLFDALLAMATLADIRDDHGLAELVLGQAASLGVDDGRALRLRDQAQKARASRLARHRKTVQRYTGLARDGALNGEAYQEALFEIMALRERQTVEMLAAQVRGHTDVIRAAARDALLTTAVPDDDERRAGWRPLDGLKPLVAAHLDESLSGPLPPVLAEAVRRLEHRDQRDGSPARSADQILASLQLERLCPEGRHGHIVLRLCCEALGLLGDPAGAEEVLWRYQRVERDERRAKVAAIALARLSRARRSIVGRLVAQVSGPARRWPHDGPLWRSVESVLRRVRPDERSLAPRSRTEAQTAKALRERARVLSLSGRLQESLEDYAGAIRLQPDEPQTYVNRGLVLLLLRREEAALADLDRALALRPDTPAWLGIRAKIHRSMGAFETARTDLDRALRLRPGLAPLWLQRGRLELELGRPREALVFLRGASERAPQRATVAATLARAHHDLGQPVKTLEAARRATQLDPRNEQGLAYQALALLKLGRVAEAEAAGRQLQSLAGEAVISLFVSGQLALSRGDAREAVLYYNRVIAVLPRDVRTIVYRGLALIDLDDTAAAAADFARAIEIAPRCAMAFYGRAMLALRTEGRGSRRALADLGTAIAISDAHLYRMARAPILLDLARPDEALRDVEAAMAAVPGQGMDHALRAMIQLARGELAAARADADRAVELAPRRAHAWYLHGRVREQTRDPRGALADFSRALALQPLHLDARIHRANLRLITGDAGGAAEDLSTVIRQAPRNPEGYFYRANVRLSAAPRDPKGAAEDCRRAIELDPRRWQPWMTLGQALLRLGQRKDGEAALRKAMTLTPPPQARVRLEQLLGQLGQD